MKKSQGGPAFIPADSIHTPLSRQDLDYLLSGPYVWQLGEGWRATGWVRRLGRSVS